MTSTQECKFRGPHLPYGDVDYECTTHYTLLQFHTNLAPSVEDWQNARLSDLYCPANPTYRHPEKSKSNLLDPLGQAFEQGCEVMYSTGSYARLYRGTVTKVTAKRIRVLPHGKDPASKYDWTVVIEPKCAVIVDKIVGNTNV